jgi:hypothetical protein
VIRVTSQWEQSLPGIFSTQCIGLDKTDNSDDERMKTSRLLICTQIHFQIVFVHFLVIMLGPYSSKCFSTAVQGQPQVISICMVLETSSSVMQCQWSWSCSAKWLANFKRYNCKDYDNGSGGGCWVAMFGLATTVSTILPPLLAMIFHNLILPQLLPSLCKCLLCLCIRWERL